MRRTLGPVREVAVARTTFNMAAVTVGGLYLATHSVPVTIIGTLAATALTGWAMWLPRSRNKTLTDGEAPATPPASSGRSRQP